MGDRETMLRFSEASLKRLREEGKPRITISENGVRSGDDSIKRWRDECGMLDLLVGHARDAVETNNDWADWCVVNAYDKASRLRGIYLK